MHELSVCQSILSQAGRIARDNGAARIGQVTVQIGPLSGVEVPLLERAFEIASLAAGDGGILLRVETAPVKIHCASCDSESAAEPNRLVCSKCGNWRVRLVSGDQMILKSVELEMAEEAAPSAPGLN